MTQHTTHPNEDLERSRDEFDSGDVRVDETEQAVVVETENSGRSAVLSVRLPVPVIALLKRTAEAQGLGATVFARHLIVSALADIQQNTPRPVHLILTVSGSQVVDVMIDDPVAAIGNNAKEIE